jgi:hypothetical protein
VTNPVDAFLEKDNPKDTFADRIQKTKRFYIPQIATRIFLYP